VRRGENATFCRPTTLQRGGDDRVEQRATRIGVLAYGDRTQRTNERDNPRKAIIQILP
jgi:hypothetical protein